MSRTPPSTPAPIHPRIGLLSPYCGGNLGDAAIHEAIIGAIRRHVPAADLYGLSLSPQETTALHGIPAFPVAGVGTAHYPVAAGNGASTPAAEPAAPSPGRSAIKGVLQRIPPLFRLLRGVRDAGRAARAEIAHVVRSYRLLRRSDLLVIAGGGQLDEEWGGAWGHPYALYKWSVLARLAGTPLAFVSVGACRVHTRLGRRFLSRALGGAVYRSYRDADSRARVEGWGVAGPHDLAPDLAFGLATTPTRPGATTVAGGEGPDAGPIAISPIAFGDPRAWPTPDPAGYARYVRGLADAVEVLLRRGRRIVWFSTARPDQQVIDDVLAALPQDARDLARERTSRPSTRTLAELLPVLRGARTVIASRLHGVVLAHLHGIPVLALSYDPKVVEHMRQMGQMAHCLEIGAFEATSLLARLAALEAESPAVRRELASRVAANRDALDRQVLRVLALGRGGAPWGARA